MLDDNNDFEDADDALDLVGDDDESDGDVFHDGLSAREHLEAWQRTCRVFGRWISASKVLILFSACLLTVSLVADSLGADDGVHQLVQYLCGAAIALCGLVTVCLADWRYNRATSLLPAGTYMVGEGERMLTNLARMDGEECPMSPDAPWASFTDEMWQSVWEAHEGLVDKWQAAFDFAFMWQFVFLGGAETFAGALGLSLPGDLILPALEFAFAILALVCVVASALTRERESRAKLAIIDAMTMDLLLDTLEDEAVLDDQSDDSDGDGPTEA